MEGKLTLGLLILKINLRLSRKIILIKAATKARDKIGLKIVINLMAKVEFQITSSNKT